MIHDANLNWGAEVNVVVVHDNTRSFWPDRCRELLTLHWFSFNYTSLIHLLLFLIFVSEAVSCLDRSSNYFPTQPNAIIHDWYHCASRTPPRSLYSLQEVGLRRKDFQQRRLWSTWECQVTSKPLLESVILGVHGRNGKPSPRGLEIRRRATSVSLSLAVARATFSAFCCP